MLLTDDAREGRTGTRTERPRLGFLGLGWIGRNRMEAVARSGLCEIVALADPSPDAVQAAAASAPDAARGSGLDAVLAARPDGVVIATPSAGHAAETIACLEAGAAVFCQKPLGRNRDEAAAAVAAARRADRLLGVDLCYRRTAAMTAVRDSVASGDLGTIFAADLVFHNAYGPDKPWFYDPAQSGGGCVMDLGVHLVDAAMWVLDFPQVDRVRSALFQQGRRLPAGRGAVEDYAVATLELTGGAAVRLTCSWNLHAGRDAEISAAFHGTEGGAVFSNVNGSFYDFTAAHNARTQQHALAAPPDDWGGRTVLDWAGRLARNGGAFDPAADRLISLAEVIDRIYGGR